MKGCPVLLAVGCLADAGRIMKIRPTLLVLFSLLTIFVMTGISRAQDDVYLVNGDQLMRWRSGGVSERPHPYSIPWHGTMPRIGSIAVNTRSVAYITSGVSSDIFRTDGQTQVKVYTHGSQVRQLAFGSADNVLFFSAVDTPQGVDAPLADGNIFSLNLLTGVAELRYRIAQNDVEHDWWGAFTVDRDRIYLATLRGGIYELLSGRPAQIYRNTADRISALTIAVNDLLYVTGGAEVYRLKQMRDREVILTVPGARLTGISYAALPYSTSEGEPCELIVELTGSNSGAISLFGPAISGPNLRWLTPDLAPHGGRIGPGRFRYFLLQGIYWVRMDTKADYPGAAPHPAIREVNCTVSQAHAAFSF